MGAEADGSENILDAAASVIKDIGIKNWGEQKKTLRLGEVLTQDKDCT